MTLKTLFDNVVQHQDYGTYLFTTHLTPDLFDFLKDDYNWEMTLRLVDDLSQQLKIQSVTNFEFRCKKLMLNLFSKLIINYIKSLLQQSNFEPWEELNFTYSAYGKPELLINGQPLQFNSSSSNYILSIVVSIQPENLPIGIDLSHSRQQISTNDLLQDFKPIFSKHEYNYLSDIKDISKRYFQFNFIWTLKEAFTKLLGSGLNIDLNQFYFTIEDPDLTGEPEYNPETISQFDINWNNKTAINIDELVENRNSWILQLQSRNFRCQSGILKSSPPDLPVIISIISQQNQLIKSFNINFESVLLNQ